MKDIIKLCVLLAAVCFVSGLALGLVNDKTAPLIKKVGEENLRESLGVVLPAARRFSDEKVRDLPGGGGIDYYEGYSSSGKIIGYALIGEKQGYQSLIRVLVGIDPGGVIQAIKVLQQAETPGLGTRIEEVKADETLWGRIARSPETAPSRKGPERPWFQAQYDGLTVNDLQVVRPPFKGEKGIHALTGATITSRALTNAVKGAITGFLSARQGGGDG